jgi:hypothetical protein
VGYFRALPDEDDELDAMERAYERSVTGDDGPGDYRNGVAVGSRLSLAEYEDDGERDR